MKAEEQFASLDAANHMFHVLARFLHGEDSGAILPLSRPVMRRGVIPAVTLLLRLPYKLRGEIARRVGIREANPPERMSEINAEQIAEYEVGFIPKRQYPAIAIGSANGAVTHLCAALQIPWLPQTLLVLARRDIPPDELTADLEFGRRIGPRILENNPNIALYQMNDPSNDRLMAQKMAYFRTKYLALPRAYRDFIAEHLQPGGTILVVEDHHERPMTQISDRHYYQVGGLGGTTLSEYLSGSERVREMLRRYNSPHDHFIIPEPTTTRREAEWGFEPSLLDDVREFAAEHGYQVRRLTFENPEAISPVVADLYRSWYEELSQPADQLSIESYTNLEAVWALRTGSVPLWLTFNGEDSLATAVEYTQSREFRQIYFTAFSNTVHTLGIPSIDEWRAALGGVGREVTLVGTHEHAFPSDVSSPFWYYFDFKETVPSRYPLPPAMKLERAAHFIAAAQAEGVQWL